MRDEVERSNDARARGHNSRTNVGYYRQEVAMKIEFRHDVDQVLKDAKTQQKPVLLDFSAAPM